MRIGLRATGIGLVLAMLAGGAAVAADQMDISLGGLGTPYFAVPVAEAKGFFAQEGLRVKVETFEAGGGNALQALIGGSTDAVAGYYDHTLQMQAQGKHITCVALLDKLPGLVLAVRKDLAGEIRTLADLRGRRVGVTDLGGASVPQLKYLAGTAGVQMADMTVVAVGSGATSVAAVERKQVDALMAYEPGATVMEQRDLIAKLIDSRTVEGTMAAYGTLYPSACLYMAASYIQAHPDRVQRAVNAVVHALRWMNAASPDEIAAVLPKQYGAGDPKVLRASIAAIKPGYPQDGRFDRAAVAHALDVLSSVNPKIHKDSIDLDDTFTNRFVDAVPPAAAGTPDAAAHP